MNNLRIPSPCPLPASGHTCFGINLLGEGGSFAGGLRASSYERMGKYDLALADWGIMAEKNPDNPYYLGEMSRLYVQTGKYDKAIQSYSRVLALKPESYLVRGAHYNRARAYALRGEAENAMQDLKKAIQLDAGYRNDARKDAAFASLRHRPDFSALVGK